ncbi:MAG TPA: hypothetical protein VM889_04365 [Candidatus Thermoplasmatota archaeon]|nr:hypothetical protein [Candidatus Thermoplasmatota archaeon]
MSTHAIKRAQERVGFVPTVDELGRACREGVYIHQRATERGSFAQLVCSIRSTKLTFGVRIACSKIIILTTLPPDAASPQGVRVSDFEGLSEVRPGTTTVLEQLLVRGAYAIIRAAGMKSVEVLRNE